MLYFHLMSFQILWMILSPLYAFEWRIHLTTHSKERTRKNKIIIKDYSARRSFIYKKWILKVYKLASGSNFSMLWRTSTNGDITKCFLVTSAGYTCLEIMHCWRIWGRSSWTVETILEGKSMVNLKTLQLILCGFPLYVNNKELLLIFLYYLLEEPMSSIMTMTLKSSHQLLGKIF